MSDQSKKPGRYLLLFAFVLLLCPQRVYAADTERQAGASMKEAAAIEEGVWYVGTLTEQNTVGWYRFTTHRQAGYYWLSLRNLRISNYVTAAIVGKNQEQLISIGSAEDSTNSEMIRLKANTTYYIKIRNTVNDHPDSGRFRVWVSFAAADREGDTYDHAFRLANRKTYAASLEGYSDVDWYCFTATTTGKYTITVKKANQKGYMELFGKEVFDVQGTRWIEILGSTRVISVVKGQTYYIKVRGQAGYYPARYDVTITRNIKPKTIRLNRSGTIYLDRVYNDNGKKYLWVKSVSPNNASPAVRWKSSNSDVIIVRGRKLCTRHPGTAIVSAISVNDSSVRASVVIVVRPLSADPLVHGNTPGQLRLVWSTEANVAAYEIYRADSKNGAYTKIAEVRQSGTSYTDRDVIPGREYYYKLRTYTYTSAEGKRIYSNFSKSRWGIAK